jgi:hypothetical protein
LLVLGFHNVRPELDLSPLRVEGRAALYSFGFLLRRAVSVLLDINEWELRVGLRVVRDAQGQVVGQVFLSDSLENGAGYCSQFAQPTELERLLRFVADLNGTFLGGIVAAHHADSCQTSCPDCLRDYANLAWHCILDWRLAVDVARLALDPNAPIEFAQPHWAAFTHETARAYFTALGGTLTELNGVPACLDVAHPEMLTHPLWAEPTHPIIVAADVAAAANGVPVLVKKTLFEAVRRPF